jgi:hypothetical protein
LPHFIRYSARAGILAIALGSLALAQQPGTAQPSADNTLGTHPFVPFDQFMANTASAVQSAATAKVANAADLTEMRQHIMNLYQGVHVTHSFVQGSQILDCIPIDQQPSVRMLSLTTIAAPPAARPDVLPDAPAAGATTVLEQFGEATGSSLLPTTAVDRFGNATSCEDHTVPIQRTTLEQISRFPTLKAFLSKSSDANAHLPGQRTSASVLPNAIPASVTHKYNTAYQWVYNLGGNSNLNLWNPYIMRDYGEVFSLSQVWYSGVAADGFSSQTVEAGWQVFPDRLGDEVAHLFVYFTADGYRTSGCYDHSCPGFVQYSYRVYPGSTFPAYSQYLGNQTEAQVLWEWWYGNWWLNVSGEWVGYYPGYLFGSGEMATHSTMIQYGGEIVADATRNVYPPMGSGRYAENGWQSAAYQRQIWYFDSGWVSHSPSLTANPNNTCSVGSSFSGPSAWAAPWGIYFFFGGPGWTC